MSDETRGFINRAWEDRGNIWKETCLRAKAALAAAEQRATDAEAQVARLRAIEEAARELMAFPDVTYMLVTDDYTEQERQNIDDRWQKVEDFLKVALTAPATQPDERAAAERAVVAAAIADRRHFNECDACQDETCQIGAEYTCRLAEACDALLALDATDGAAKEGA